MEIKHDLQLKQTQRLIMTPQLQQAIKMLQLSNIELNETIEEEIIDNPALELDEREGESDHEFDKDGKNNKYDDVLDDEYWFDDKSFPRIDRTSGEDKKREFMENAISREETLKEYLLWQLSLINLTEEDFDIAKMLVSYIDTQGYLPLSTESLVDEINIPQKKLEKIIELIQTLDPSGVGARSIEECLLIQLKMRGSFPIAEKIAENYLEMVKLNKCDEIARKLKVPLGKVNEAITIISKLEPYPGRQFFSEEIKYIIPEVIIEEREGNFEVIPNNYSLPKLRVNSYFKNLMQVKGGDKRIKEFAAERVQRAKNFMHSIAQRESTLIRVTKTILEEQKEFFQNGPKYLKPLKLKDVSLELELHESTISRITSSKYVQTPFGVFPLKYFFSNSIPTQGSMDYSAISIKERIKEIIENEGLNKHLSDQKITDLLEKRGIKIARRTVAKYRKGLKILPSNLRR